jgi:hypothetical protein
LFNLYSIRELFPSASGSKIRSSLMPHSYCEWNNLHEKNLWSQ